MINRGLEAKSRARLASRSVSWARTPLASHPSPFPRRAIPVLIRDLHPQQQS